MSSSSSFDEKPEYRRAFSSPRFISTKEAITSAYRDTWPTLLGLGLLLFTIYSIYFGSAFEPQDNLFQINAYIADFDNSTIGHATVAAFRALNRVNWVFVDSTVFATPADCIRETLSGSVFLSIIIHANATTNWTAALANNMPTYDPAHAWSIVYDESRQPLLYSSVLLPMVRSVLDSVSYSLARAAFVNQFPSHSAAVAAWLQVAAATELNLRVNSAPVANAASSIGMLCLFMVSMLSVNSVHTALDTLLRGRVRAWQMLAARWAMLLPLVPVLALLNSLTNLLYEGVFMHATLGAYFGFVCLIIL